MLGRVACRLGAAAVIAWALAGAAAAESEDEAVARHSRALVFGAAPQVQEAVAFLRTRGKPDVAAAMILALRYTPDAAVEISSALQAITGHQAFGWFHWMVWQETNPEVRPHSSFVWLKLDVLRALDPNFLRFFRSDWIDPGNMRIRLEEITWGGVRVDGIPSLDEPELIAAAEADYLLDDDLVFGVEIDGDVRAYPLRIMGWHEMFNEVIGGVPVALAYCTLCGAGILFETEVEGRDDPLIFGSSGLLYRSNKLMFDRQTNSLWNQFTGEPVVGPLVGSGIRLAMRPVVITTWAEWRRAHPESRVLSLDTGFSRDYGSGVVYADYFASPNLMFPTRVDESRLAPKDLVFGIRDVGAAKAWPLAAFAGGAVINDSVGAREVVLVGDAETRTVRAYDRGGRSFEATGEAMRLRGPGGTWTVEEERLSGPDGTALPRLPGHVAYWFAWDGYMGVQSELYRAPE